MSAAARAYHGQEIRFSCAHFYYRNDWSEQKNTEVFGLCANRRGHGHNYRLIVLVPSSLDPLLLKSCLKKIKEEWDHQNLNFLPEFQNQIPTTESLVEVLVERLKKELNTEDLIVRLYETDDLWVEWRGHG